MAMKWLDAVSVSLVRFDMVEAGVWEVYRRDDAKFIGSVHRAEWPFREPNQRAWIAIERCVDVYDDGYERAYEMQYPNEGTAPTRKEAAGYLSGHPCHDGQGTADEYEVRYEDD